MDVAGSIEKQYREQDVADCHWDEEESGADLSIGGRSVTKESKYGSQSCYLQPTFSYNSSAPVRIQFKLKINRCRYSSLKLGIIDNSVYKDSDFCRSHDKAGKNKVKSLFYVLACKNGDVMSHQSNYEWEKWKDNCQVESKDEVIIELNFIEKNIKYYKNDQLIGIMYDRINVSPKIKYRLGVSLSDKNDSISLINVSKIAAKAVRIGEKDMDEDDLDYHESQHDSDVDIVHRSTFVKLIDILLNVFVFWYCSKCCNCKCCQSDRKKLTRHTLYSSITFTYSWLYFVGSIFIVPFTAQMFLNSLATATAVTIFIKRKELHLQHFRVITGIFTPVIIFMSAYAVWSLRDTISQSVIDDSPDIKLFSLGVFIAVVNGFWIILCTLYIIIIEDEMNKCDLYYITYDWNGKVVSKTKVDSWMTGRVGNKMSNKLGSIILGSHIVLGFFYLFLCVLFLRENEVFTLEVVLYGMCLILGAICFQYFFFNNDNNNKDNKKHDIESNILSKQDSTYNLASIEICTQLIIFCLGVSGTRVLFALLGGLDFGNIFILPSRIIIAAFLCWVLLVYRTLEVIESNMK